MCDELSPVGEGVDCPYRSSATVHEDVDGDCTVGDVPLEEELYKATEVVVDESDIDVEIGDTLLGLIVGGTVSNGTEGQSEDCTDGACNRPSDSATDDLSPPSYRLFSSRADPCSVHRISLGCP